MRGGIDLETPFPLLAMGALIDAVNYECLPKGGYRRIKGYALYDGHSPAAAPVGSGAIRGVWIYQGVAYCFRDNAGGTAGQMYKASGSGWALQSMPTYLTFTAGDRAFIEGETITGGTSGATARVVRYGATSGAIASSTLAGTLVIDTIVGTFQAGEALKIGGVAHGTNTAAKIVYALPAGGSYKFSNYNFLADAASQRMYGASGVGAAFEWDGTTFFPILQQVGSAWPTDISGHNDHLHLGFGTTGLLRISSIGAPRDYLSTTDAADIGVGDEIRELRSIVGGVLLVGCKLSTKILYGTDATTWDMKHHSDNGVFSRSMKEAGGTTLVTDVRGVQRLNQTQAFGDFQSIGVSVPVNRKLLPTFALSAPSCSIVSKNKDQYRLYFGKIGFCFTFNGTTMVGVTMLAYNHDVLVTCDGLDATGAEFLLFGDSSGNVFQLDTTNKFNGSNIIGGLSLAYVTQGAPTQRKKYGKATFYLQVEGDNPALQCRAFFNLQDGTLPVSALNDIVVNGISGTNWDDGAWDTFDWAGDSAALSAETRLDGTAQNMGLVIYSPGSENGQHTFMSGVLHWSPRRLMR